MEAAATFLAAASDKTGVLTDDEIAYLNLILDIDATTMEGTDVAFCAIDYSAFTYDRATSYEASPRRSSSSRRTEAGFRPKSTSTSSYLGTSLMLQPMER